MSELAPERAVVRQEDGSVLVAATAARDAIANLMSVSGLGAALVALEFDDLKAVEILVNIAKYGDNAQAQIAAIREIRRWVESAAKTTGHVATVTQEVIRSADGTLSSKETIERHVHRMLDEKGGPCGSAEFIRVRPIGGGVAPAELEAGSGPGDDRGHDPAPPER